MHPDPLFRMPEENAFDGGIVGSGIPSDGLIRVLALDCRQRLVKTQNMGAVRFPPTGGRNHRRSRAHGQHRQAFECAGWMAKKINCDAIAAPGMLIKYKN